MPFPSLKHLSRVLIPLLIAVCSYSIFRSSSSSGIDGDEGTSAQEEEATNEDGEGSGEKLEGSPTQQIGNQDNREDDPVAAAELPNEEDQGPTNEDDEGSVKSSVASNEPIRDQDNWEEEEQVEEHPPAKRARTEQQDFFQPLPFPPFRPENFVHPLPFPPFRPANCFHPPAPRFPDYSLWRPDWNASLLPPLLPASFELPPAPTAALPQFPHSSLWGTNWKAPPLPLFRPASFELPPTQTAAAPQLPHSSRWGTNWTAPSPSMFMGQQMTAAAAGTEQPGSYSKSLSRTPSRAPPYDFTGGNSDLQDNQMIPNSDSQPLGLTSRLAPPPDVTGGNRVRGEDSPAAEKQVDKNGDGKSDHE